MATATPAEGSALETVHPWMRRLTRVGFLARGALYSMLGLLTLWSIAHHGASAHGGMKTTFNSIHSVGPGVVLLAGLALGFAGFAIGMMWIAIFDLNFHGGGPLGLLRRAATFIAGLVHVGLVVSSVLLIAGHQSEGYATRRWTEMALRYPFGREGVAIAGLYAIGFGSVLLSQVWTGKIDPQLDLRSLDPVTARLANWTGRFGMLARGVIYITIGIVLAIAAFRGDASQVVGLGGAMRTVSEHAYGVASLAVIASGLFAYGCFMFIEARYRRIGEPI
jgi:Domain of Unknown Function (DUF1206)